MVTQHFVLCISKMLPQIESNGLLPSFEPQLQNRCHSLAQSYFLPLSLAHLAHSSLELNLFPVKLPLWHVLHPLGLPLQRMHPKVVSFLSLVLPVLFWDCFLTAFPFGCAFAFGCFLPFFGAFFSASVFFFAFKASKAALFQSSRLWLLSLPWSTGFVCSFGASTGKAALAFGASTGFAALASGRAGAGKGKTGTVESVLVPCSGLCKAESWTILVSLVGQGSETRKLISSSTQQIALHQQKAQMAPCVHLKQVDCLHWVYWKQQGHSQALSWAKHW